MSLRERGFTLAELIITMVMVSVLMGAIGLAYNVGFRVFYSHKTRIGGKSEAGRSLSTMAQEVRTAVSVTSAQASSLTFSADTDNDGINESIQYSWSGTAGAPLQRISTLTTLLASSVNSLSLTYYDSNNNLLSFPVTASSVRIVSFDLTVKSQDETFQLRSQTRLRNLS